MLMVSEWIIYIITDTTSKLGKSPNAHKDKKYRYQLFKDKLVLQVVAKANCFKGTERIFCFNVLCMPPRKGHIIQSMFTYTRTLVKYQKQVVNLQQDKVVVVNM